MCTSHWYLSSFSFANLDCGVCFLACLLVDILLLSAAIYEQLDSNLNADILVPASLIFLARLDFINGDCEALGTELRFTELGVLGSNNSGDSGIVGARFCGALFSLSSITAPDFTSLASSPRTGEEFCGVMMGGDFASDSLLDLCCVGFALKNASNDDCLYLEVLFGPPFIAVLFANLFETLSSAELVMGP
ncbi:hypothetical protein OGATHE_004858 [Ogataea polymorpha]|uniref:Uncharacterized protein n=1 Tax=Ogataea polymorpha TaxID=460523 RepID=A0A9P8P1W5_9ASCO|nr:hypothetical protein OGATHE_004858 [Ogataea polymorpha]